MTNPDLGFDGKVAVITGASGAFGALAAKVLAGAGCRLVLSAGKAAELDAVATDCEGLGAEVDLIAFMQSRYLGLKAFGELYGYLFAIFMLANGIGPFVMGLSFDKAGSYVPVLWVFAGGLHPPSTATVIRAGGEVLLTDGPFVEGKEHLGGFTVIEAETADRALAILNDRADEVSVVFSDVRTPGPIGGFELARIIGVTWPRVRVLLTSGDAGDQPSDLRVSATFIPKPWRAERAASKVLVSWLWSPSANDVARWSANAVALIAVSIASLWIGPSWLLWAVYGLFALLGFTTGAWAGTVLAEAGRLAPRDKASAALAGMFVYLNSGKMIGPLIFANVYLATQSYAWALASLAVPAVLALMWLSKNNSIKSNT